MGYAGSLIMKSIFDELQASFKPIDLEVRAENAWHVAVKFLTLLQEEIEDDDERRKLMATWMRAVKDKDYPKFKKALKRYNKKKDT